MSEPKTQRMIREEEREAKHKRHQELIETYGEDTWSDTTVWAFFKRFGNNDKAYLYAGVKTQGLWSVTGSADRLTWYDLLEFFEKENRLGPDTIMWATSWEPVYEVEELDD